MNIYAEVNENTSRSLTPECLFTTRPDLSRPIFHSNKPDSIPTLPCVQNKVRPRTIYRTDVCNIITSVHQTRNSCFM